MPCSVVVRQRKLGIHSGGVMDGIAFRVEACSLKRITTRGLMRVSRWHVVSALALLTMSSAEAAPPDKGTATNPGTSTQNWDRNLPASTRFTVLTEFGGAAVRDNNTGLVWKQSPDGTTLRQWDGALDNCLNRTIAGTSGWRLPSVVELNSLRDSSLPPPYVPAIFSSVQMLNYWTATTVTSAPDAAWDVRLGNGLIGRSGKAGWYLVWCVRGPMNSSAY